MQGYTIWKQRRVFSDESSFVDFCQKTVERLTNKGGPDGFETIVSYDRDEERVILHSISDWDSGVVDQVEFEGQTVLLSDLVWQGLPE